MCATGCSAATIEVEGLSEQAFEELLEQYSEHAFDEPTRALETLLFYSTDVRELTERLGLGALDAEHAEFLEREIERGHAQLSVRMLGEEGEERLRLGPVRVPLNEKQHLLPERSLNLQVPEISGTVRRVGVTHLWTRL